MTFIQKLFSFKGRLDRKQYWQILSVPIITGVAIAVLFGSGIITNGLSTDEAKGLATIFITIIGLLGGWIAVSATVRRLRDSNKPLWLSALAIIPKYNFLLFIICTFFPSIPDTK